MSKKRRYNETKIKSLNQSVIFSGMSVFEFVQKIEELKQIAQQCLEDWSKEIPIHTCFFIEDLEFYPEIDDPIEEISFDIKEVSDITDDLPKKEQNVDQKGEMVKKVRDFFEVNHDKGLTKKEVADFLGVKDYRTAKKKIVSLGLEQYLDMVIDLRKSRKKVNLGSQIKEVEEINSKESELDTSYQSNQEDNVVNDMTDSSSKEEQKSISVDNNSYEGKSIIKFKYVWDDITGTENFILGMDLLTKLGKLGRDEIKAFEDFLNEFITVFPYKVPKFWFFKSDIINLDNNKTTSVLSRQIMRFIALDESYKYTKLINTDRPDDDELIKLCNENDITYITGNAYQILKFKLNCAKIYVPTMFKKAYPNPFKGEGIVGIDTCALLVQKEDFMEYIVSYSSILISQIQLEEFCKNCDSYPLKICAYYGDIKYADCSSEEKADINIVLFYKKNHVSNIITRDYGFKVFARLEGLECQLVKIQAQKSSNSLEIYDYINGQYNKFKNQEISTGNILDLSDATESRGENSLKIFKDNNNIVVYTNSGRKRNSNMYVEEAYNQDYVVIRKKDKILVFQIINSAKQLAKVCFYGEVKDMPKKYKSFI